VDGRLLLLPLGWRLGGRGVGGGGGFQFILTGGKTATGHDDQGGTNVKGDNIFHSRHSIGFFLVYALKMCYKPKLNFLH
jgi:hypothetical protein